MKLRISCDTIKVAVAPYQFTPIDILSIMPRVLVGNFECCAITLACSKVLIISNEIILVYNKLEDFFNGFDPLSLVKDTNIYYDQESRDIDFQVIPENNMQIDNEEFSKVRELMFGAREANAQLIDGLDSAKDAENSDHTALSEDATNAS